jgi:uncharacterized protein
METSKEQLMDIARRGDLAEAELLLDEMPIMNGRRIDAEKLLAFAAGFGKYELVVMLLNNGVSIRNHGPGSFIPLIAASIEGHTETIRFLLNHGADVNAQDHRGYSPLIWAATYGHTEVVRLFLQHDINLNLMCQNDTIGRLAYIFAAVHEHRDVMNLLRQAGIVIEQE